MAAGAESERVELLSDNMENMRVRYFSDESTHGRRRRHGNRRAQPSQQSGQLAMQEEIQQLKEKLVEVRSELQEVQRTVQNQETVQNQQRGQEDGVRVRRNGAGKRWLLLIIAMIILLVLVTSGSLALGGYNQFKIASTGATYERFGAEGCDKESSTFIYAGITVGFTTESGSTTFKCLPSSSSHIHYHIASESEYKNTSEVFFVNATKYVSFQPNRTGNYVHCAKCCVEGRSVVEVLPVATVCQPSWTREYAGYLMTDRGSTEFVCVDRAMRYSNSSSSEDGPTLNHVVADLSDISHFEKKYNSSQVLSCVVCSK